MGTLEAIAIGEDLPKRGKYHLKRVGFGFFRKIGVENIEIVDPNNIKDTTAAFKRALDFRGPAVVVSKSPCTLLESRNKRKSREKKSVYRIDQEKCNQCKTCIIQFGCPALFYAENGTIHINDTQCNGCGNCVEVCKFGAIYKKEGDK